MINLGGASVCLNQCPNLICVISHGYAVTTMDQSWDGRYQGPSACSASWLVPTSAVPGQYVAQFCATPRTLTIPDGGEPVCTAMGTEVCGPVHLPKRHPRRVTAPRDRRGLTLSRRRQDDRLPVRSQVDFEPASWDAWHISCPVKLTNRRS